MNRMTEYSGRTTFAALAILLVVLPSHHTTANWMYLGVVSVASPLPGQDNIDEMCAQYPGLVTQQLQVCREKPHTFPYVSEGARRGIVECQYQFKYERWNCTVNARNGTVFDYVLDKGLRETAFLYGVTSAGVVHAVTQSCSAGNLTDCSCDMSRQGQTDPVEGWKWGGCSDNVNYGLDFSRKFVDAPDKIKHKKLRDVRNLMNLQNNEAGRRAIQSLVETQCRCHGVSGSCQMKTCWKTIPTFKRVGEKLKELYEHSIHVAPRARRKLRRKGRALRKVAIPKEYMVYTSKSPNYCVVDLDKGILGTSGRVCNKTSTGSDSCDLLCCGRGYNTQIVRHVERCNCKFIYCCYVKCRTCETMVDVHTCK
ncbi:PREDICTED: protein Wnt-16-like [Priapulus caudatus]|uniref:Protein Wnt n=2 Tax=Priapulus caudatus TaxID=37621 RepID=A0ABM1EZU9_PRICU|nr:PREDICTED: protein Wnt-16-like [Priapulus caudatus]